MVASIGAVAVLSQGASYYERDGYYAKDDPAHRAASAWAGKGAADPDTFKAVLEGVIPDGSGHRLGRKTRDGGIEHRPGRDLTFSAPKSVSLMALAGGDAHGRTVGRALDWFRAERRRDPVTGPGERAHGAHRASPAFASASKAEAETKPRRQQAGCGGIWRV